MIITILKSVLFSLEHKISGTTGSTTKVKISIWSWSTIFFGKIQILVKKVIFRHFLSRKVKKEVFSRFSKNHDFPKKKSCIFDQKSKIWVVTYPIDPIVLLGENIRFSDQKHVFTTCILAFFDKFDIREKCVFWRNPAHGHILVPNELKNEDRSAFWGSYGKICFCQKLRNPT